MLPVPEASLPAVEICSESSVAGIAPAQFAEKAPVDLVDNLQVARQQAADELHRPLLERLEVELQWLFVADRRIETPSVNGMVLI